MTQKLGDLLGAIPNDTMTDGGAAPPPHQVNPGPGKPDCPICQGIGYIRRDVPFGHADFGKVLPCTCRLEDIRSAQESRLAQMASLGPLSDKTFDNYLPEGHTNDALQRNSLRLALEMSKRFAEHPRDWLLLAGGYGVGKTHLAAAIANYHLANGGEVVFATVPDLLDHLRATFAPLSSISYDDLFERVRNIPLLVLDDLGTESPTPWAQEKLYQIINYRYNAKLPTVVTTNVDLDRIEGRVRSRLVDADLVRMVLIDAPDFRRGLGESQHRLSSLEQHHHYTFESFDPTRKGELLEKQHTDELQAAFGAARVYAENPKGWLILMGAHGTGKTHLAAAVANQVVAQGGRALFVTCADLLDHLRATFSPDSAVRYDKLFTEVRTAPFLVLDALMLEGTTAWAREKLMQIIEYRYVAQLPTVITTSADRFEMGERLETRLLDRSQNVVCILTGPIYKSATGGRPSAPPPPKRGGRR